MKISRLELAALFMAAVFLAFAGGWFLRGGGQAAPLRVETERRLTDNQPVLALPAPTPPIASGQGNKVNINTADVESLRDLPGIGEKRAEDIIDYRTQHGPFRIPEELTRVPGIGEGTLEGLLELITIGEEHP